VNLRFLLAIIEAWNGYCCNQWAPNYFVVQVDGRTVFNHSFANPRIGDPQIKRQDYVAPPGVLLSNDVHFVNDAWPGQALDMGMDPTFANIPHTASTLTVGWTAAGGGWAGGTNSWWAIDNVSVELIGTAAQPAVGVEKPALEAPPQGGPGFWYYCQSARAYYPTVQTCPEAWVKVPAKTQ
jgi:hypothetical protein